MYNLRSYCGLVDPRISASDNDLPVTVPAYISDSQRQAIKDVGIISVVNVLGMVSYLTFHLSLFQIFFFLI